MKTKAVKTAQKPVSLRTVMKLFASQARKQEQKRIQHTLYNRGRDVLLGVRIMQMDLEGKSGLREMTKLIRESLT